MREGKTWVLLLTIIMEGFGSAFFFDTFLGRRKTKKGAVYQYRFLAYLGMTFALSTIGYLIGMWKLPLFALGYILLGRIIYKAGCGQDLFFSMINYSMMFQVDFVAYCLMHLWEMQETAKEGKEWVWIVSAKGLWFAVLFILRRLWKDSADYKELTNREWMKLSLMPLFTLSVILMMFYQYGNAVGTQVVNIFISAGLVVVNFLVIWLLQEILEKGKKLREGVESARKTESQLAHYRDMQAVYERQGRKLHDYKNQIRTIQVLLKESDTQAAAALAERLTESISVEMAAVNTNHPVVDAVLNQKFHAAREQGVSMIFKVGDMGGLKLNEEETVILLSNLLDNAIRECAKVVQEGRKAVISIKLVQEDGRMICSIKNPVTKKVQITDGIVPDSDGGIHGVGLMNVKAVVDQYGGDFAVSCDEKKFRAVVIL